MEKILITPKNKSASIFLKKLFSQLEGIDDIEVLNDGEVRDDELLKRMKRNLTGGYTSREKVMTALNKIIQRR